MRNLRLAIFFFNDTATTEIYTLSLHDALPISANICPAHSYALPPNNDSAGEIRPLVQARWWPRRGGGRPRSEEHTSELQALTNVVCRLLLEKKNIKGTKQDSALNPLAPEMEAS